MKEFKFCICDDDKSFVEMIDKKLRDILADITDYDTVTAVDGESLVSLCTKELPDAVFLDIDMPNLNGFESAEGLRRLKEDMCIVFVTSQEDRVYESWTYQPFWFVRKSCLDDLNVVLPKLIKKLRAERSRGKAVKVRFENRMIELDLDSLLTVESQGHYVAFNHADRDPMQVRCRMSDAEEQLSQYGIVRVSKGILVNLRAVSEISGKKIILTDGGEYSIGRDRAETVKHRFLEFMRGGEL